MSLKLLRLAAQCAIAAALCVGCAQETSGNGKPPASATVESFRLLMYQPPDLELAEHRLIQRCMREQGFQYPAKVPEPGDSTGSLLEIPPRLTADKARTEGYGERITRGTGAGPATADTADRVNPLERYLDSLSPDDQARFRRALDDPDSAKVDVRLPGGARMGASSRGCRAQARLQTYGSVQNYLTIRYLPQAAQSQVGKVESDRELQQALQRYVRCLSDRGYHADSPTAAAALAEGYYGTGDTPAARQQEIALAVHDATCQEQSRFYDEYQAAVNRVAAKWISENEAAVLAAAGVQRAALDNAKKILREAS